MSSDRIAWIRAVRGIEPGPTEGLDAFLRPYGYASADAARMPWLCAAVLSGGGDLEGYVKCSGGDLAEELEASRRDALDAMDGGGPTAASFRHDLSRADFRPPLPRAARPAADEPAVGSGGADSV